MPILVNEKKREFHIQGKETSYIFKVLRNGQLGQLYYGKKIRHRESFEHLIQFPKRMVAVPSCNYREDTKFSLELLKQEYPSFGATDCRYSAMKIKQNNGSRITEFLYKKYELIAGKRKLNGLPSTFAIDEAEAITLEVTLVDDLINTELVLTYSLFEEFDVITRDVRIKNNGEENLIIERLMSCSIDFPDMDYKLIHLSGAWVRERHVKERKLEHGIQSIQSSRGGSSHTHNPFIALKRDGCNEHKGEVFGLSLVYSGNFLAQVEVDQFDVSRAMIGINPETFAWNLKSGEEFQAPEVVMVYSSEGLNGLSQKYHSIYRNRLAKGKWQLKERPVLINNWEATYFDFNEEKILEIAKTAQSLGIELFVLDDGWFGERDDDTSSLGDWFEDREKLPNGLKGLGEKINNLGMEFGLWFEPEMINKISELYKLHPDWLLQISGRDQSPGRFQHVLDFSNDEVIEYIYERMYDILENAPISYVKWDMNRSMSEVGSLHLSSDEQMEVYHRYILGLYKLLDRITSSFPDILFESCASGGGRFDPGMLYYMPQTWTSDDTDAVERLKIQYGTSMVYPLSAMGAHVSDVPNHQCARISSLEMRADVANFGNLGYELDLNKLTAYEKRRVKEQINFYKKYRNLFQYGTFYRLISPFEKSGNETAWMVVSQDKKEAIAAYYRVLAKPNPGFKGFRLVGLNEKLEYEIDGKENTYFGDELMNVGIKLDPEFDGTSASELTGSLDFQGTLFVLKGK